MVVPSDLCAHAACDRFPISLVVVAAADRAAATYAMWGTNPSARLRRAPPLSGEALRGSTPKGSLRPPPPHARKTPMAIAIGVFMCLHAACPRRLCQPPWTQLSLSETRHLSGGPPYAEAHKPNASRSSGEGVWGRGTSLREAASPPESPQPPTSLREGARGRGLLYREAPSLAKPLRPHFFREPGFFDAALQPVAAEVVDNEEQGRDRPCDGIAEEHEVNVVMTRRDKLHPNDAQ